MSHSRPSARARSISSGSRVASVDVQTMWYCGMAHSASSFGELELLLEAPPRVAGEALVHPRAGRRGRSRRRTRRRPGAGQQHELDAVDDLAHRADDLDDRSGHVDERLAVHRVGGVEVDELADPVGGAVGDRR